MVLMGCVLQERADVWWASVLQTRYNDGAIEVTWAKLTRLFRAKFIPEHIQDKMEHAFLSLTWGSMSVLEYEAKFAELSKYAPHIVADECRKAKKFVMGLKPSLRSRLVAFDHRTLDEALSVACRQESKMDQYLEVKRATQKRSAPPFQRQDRKKAMYQSPQHPVAASKFCKCLSCSKEKGLYSLAGRRVRILNFSGEVVASSILISDDNDNVVMGKKLGGEYYEVSILIAHDPTASLFIKDADRKSMNDAVGSHIIWFREYEICLLKPVFLQGQSKLFTNLLSPHGNILAYGVCGRRDTCLRFKMP
ncbi:hypothetical protein Taro_034016 [Colocasia esculenta]|uniref:Retrotransposon gag domain-containing protein n=1 Tax=Colocasia esculenta TaxID=4460 RepID=A0A843WAN8_COLES|nr:hypothetical protein [Colocasia esculenta]